MGVIYYYTACVSLQKLILFFGVGVLFSLVLVDFLPFFWCLLWVLWVGAVSRCCCFALFYGAYPLARTRTPS